MDTNMYVVPMHGTRRESSAAVGKRMAKARRDDARRLRSAYGRSEAARVNMALHTPSWETCASKVRYVTKRQARAASIACQFQFGLRLRPYECPDCGGWHLERLKATEGLQDASGDPGEPV